MKPAVRLLPAFIFAAAVLPIAAPLPNACASSGDSAALVIDLEAEGDVLSYCVKLEDGDVSGIELIALAGEQFGLEYGLGYGGEAVCMLAGLGTESDDCFAEYPDFWGYWRGDGSGGWTWSGTGSGSTSVEPGDVEGWSWGSGSDASSHPSPPQTTFASVCGTEPEPVASPSARAGTDRHEEGAGKADPVPERANTAGEDVVTSSDSSTQGKPESRSEPRRKSKPTKRIGVVGPTVAKTPADRNLQAVGDRSAVRAYEGWAIEQIATAVLVLSLIVIGFVLDNRKRKGNP